MELQKNSPEPLQSFWHIPVKDLLKQLQVSPEEGLSDQEAKRRLKQYGPSALKVKKQMGSLKLLLSQFKNPLILILLFCAVLSLVLYDKTDALIILSIIIVSTLLSFFQEKGALQAVNKLLEIVQIKATVIRNKQKKEIPIENVVPGDVVEFNGGDVIPGDCLILEAKNLFVDEATLTGETFYADKFPGELPKDTPIAQRTNTLFMGTHVVSGTATALVILTGINTEFGKISGKLSYSPPETEFENGIRRFGHFLMEVTFILLLAILAFNIYFGRPLAESLLFALALAVGLTPQLLPAIITINLAHGAKKMAKKHVIVKRLASIENFGSMNVLCCDKTGTLTTGKIHLQDALDIEGKKSGKALLYGYINAKLQKGYTNPIDEAISQDVQEDLTGWTLVSEMCYDFTRKRISILARKDSQTILITKGAFQKMIEICTHAENPSGEVVELKSVMDDIKGHFEEFSNNGFRVLGIAYRNGEGISDLEQKDEAQLIFLGFLLFLDTPKKDIEKTVANLAQLGVDLKIITGDNKLMAMHLANLLNIPKEKVMTGAELQKMGDHALIHQVKGKAIFAEIEPNQKERLILALRRSGNVVGYLGDGINDVTALHAADVSISVDNAADAAKEVADIVLLKNDLPVLREGIKTGRETFANTLKYIFMATSANFGNMFSMAGASLFLTFLPLLPKQVLLINLLEDFPEMAIATDNVDKEWVDKPLRWNIDFIRKFMMVFGLISSLFDYATFGMLLWLKASVIEFRTGWFVESVVSAAFIVLMIRTFRPFYKSKPSKYLFISVLVVVLAIFFLPMTPIAPFLGFSSLPWKFYLFIIGVVILYVLCVEIAKKIFLKRWLANS